MEGFVFADVKKCLACKGCEMQCAITHSKSKDLLGAINETPTPLHRMRLVRIGSLAVPLQCRHCEAAACVVVCPAGAIKKIGSSGPVVINRDLCVGCRSCIITCPFGVPRLGHESRAVIKCDLCIDRLNEGQYPACITGCPTGALKFKKLDDLNVDSGMDERVGMV